MIFLNQAALDPIVTVADQGDFSAGATIAGIDGQLDASNPVTYAGTTANHIDYLEDYQRWFFSSLAPAFSFQASASPGSPATDNVVTAWDGLDSDITPDQDLNTGGLQYDEETGIWTVQAPLAGWLEIHIALDTQKTAGGAVAWRFVLLRNGLELGRTRRQELTALADRRSWDTTFAPIAVVPADTLAIAAQPETGTETVDFFQFDAVFAPVRQG